MTINEITDHYTAPADATVMSLSKAESTWSLDRRYFDLAFGSDLVTRLVGYDALLTPGEYVLGADAIGNAIAADTKVKGASAQSGYVLVTKKDNQYQITGTFGDQVLYWTGTLPFTPDPSPLNLTVLQQTQKNQGLVTLQLATDEFTSEFDMTTWQNVLKGDGKYLALDLYSADGYLHDGEYKPCSEPGVVNEGEFGIGWDPGDLYGIGMVFSNWGTCLWTVNPDGKNTAEKITGGLLTVSSEEVEDETIWTIFWGEEYPRELLFVGPIPALTKPKPVAKDPDYLYTEVVTPDASFDLHAITITDKQGNTVAYLELLTEPGATDLSGSYASTSIAGQPGQMRDGYDGGSMEYGGQTYTWPGGGSYYVQDGEQHYLYQGTATVEVSPIAVGAYNFSCEFFSYAAAGPDYVPSGGDDYTEFVEFLGTSSYVAYGVNLAGFNIGTEGVSAGADGLYLKIEYYCTDSSGLPQPGVYHACSVGGSVGEGEFGIGYDGMFGASGTTLYTVSGGQYPYEYITDGTLTITVEGGEYDVKLDCSLIKAHYKGVINPAG